MKTVCVIPARYGSSRLPAKPLVPLNGRPLIQWVCERALRIPVFDEVLVATDNEIIADAVRQCGVTAIMTDPALPSGSDRIHAALAGREGDIIVNLQGDEPVMPVEAVQLAHSALLSRAWADVATACVPIMKWRDFDSAQIVKVVRGSEERALYFSRSPIPSLARRDVETLGETEPFGYKHLGLYLYHRAALGRFVSMPPSPLEKIEALEQLRMLEAGMAITCVESPRDSIGVDVEDDIARAEAALRKG